MISVKSSSTNESQIRVLINERIKAVRDKDIESLLSQFSPDVVIYNLAPPLQISGPDRPGIEQWFAGYQTEIHIELRDLSIAASDEVAFCHYLYRTTGTLTGGQAADMWVRATLCLRKFDDKWLITHEHDSEPFDMQTFQAQLDLKP
jgi:uncharacterized protein (TIGR02246 family)